MMHLLIFLFMYGEMAFYTLSYAEDLEFIK